MEQPNNTHDCPYICVYCGTPCSALYRQLSASLSSITEMNCTKCNQVVDRYIEREWLLVVIDCILLRPESYRHVLFNAKEYFETVTWRRAIQLTVATSILHAYLKWETLMTTTMSMESRRRLNEDPSALLVASLGIASFLDFVVQWMTIYGFLKMMVKTNTKDKISVHAKDQNLAAKVFWALILPTAFQVTSIFVLIWENHKTTRALGSVLIVGWQTLAISIVAHPEKDVFVSTASMIGILALMLCRLGVSLALRGADVPTPCVGYEMDFLFHQDSGQTILPPLCLT